MMKNRRGAWVNRGSVAMGLLAVLALGATVRVAQRALAEASDVIVRGEGDALASAVLSDIADEEAPPTRALLEQELVAHQAEGLRYLAILGRGGAPEVEAGEARMGDAPLRPGQSLVVEKRARVAAPLMPHRRPPAHEPGVAHRLDRAGPAPLLVVELEPPIIEKLRADMTRIEVVAAIAGLVLLAFALAWSRSARRLALVEQRAAREQRLVALGGMSSVMAHELRNPLASLKGHAQLLAEDITDDRQRAKAERVVSEAERLELLTTSLLDFVRDGPIERTAIAPAELVARALTDLAAGRVEVDLTRAPATLVVDAARLARAIHNVVDNALEAAPEAAVELSVAREGDATVMTVSDHGPGITPGSEAQIFEPFVTTRVRGTGLGLAVARRIAEQHGGTLTGASRTRDGDRGAVFTIRIPARGASTDDPSPA